MQAHRRHDISDRIWENIQAHLPGSKGLVGRPANDNRLFINAVFLDIKNWRSVAGPAPGLWGLEKYSPSVLSLEGSRGLGASSGSGHC